MGKPLSDADYELPANQDSVWISVDNISVYVKRTDEGVVVDLFPKGKEMDGAIAGTYAFRAEAESGDSQ
jgi:hypothetical protein